MTIPDPVELVAEIVPCSFLTYCCIEMIIDLNFFFFFCDSLLGVWAYL
jgi:hypothetical protein